MKTTGNLHDGRGAIDVLEDAIYILRRFPETLSIYYIGSLPFVLGLLYFCTDMSQNAYGGHHLAGSAFSITLLFIWMKCCHVFFAEDIYRRIDEKILPKRGFKEYIFLISSQTVIHCTGFFIWPVALFLMLPFGSVFAFYHYSSIVKQTPCDLKMLWDKSWGYANHWSMQNHILISIFMLLYIVVFINIGAALFLAPQLLKVFFAIDSVFVLSGAHFFNTTFLATAFSLTYLLVNPVIKTAYVIRYFERNSTQYGNDIKIELHFLKAHQQTVLMAIFIVFVSATNLWADQTDLARQGLPAQSLRVESLNNSIDQVLSEREFAWRMPRTAVAGVEQKRSLTKSLVWLQAQIEKIRPMMNKVLERIGKWFSKMFIGEPNEPLKPNGQLFKMSKPLYGLIFLITALLAIALIAIWKMRKRKKIIEERPSIFPDITADTIKADDLMVDEWLNMANSLLQQGNLRHAVRAFYLGTLSHLAKAQMITIKQYKSNRDYEIEIKRRARDKQQLCMTFSQSIVFLNSAWYGDRSLEAQEVLEFARQQERIIQLANV